MGRSHLATASARKLEQRLHTLKGNLKGIPHFPAGADIVRRDRPLLKKAGNLRHAFAQTTADAIAIFDADFCPRPDFLKETVPYFGHDSSIGIVQTPQYFRYRKEQTWIEQGAGITQEFFYRLVQVKSGARS